MSGAQPGLTAAGAAAAAKPRIKATVRLQHMKFMKQAAIRTQAAAAAASPQEAAPAEGESEQWTAAGAGAPAAGCLVIVEDAPPPAAAMGRMSFRGFNAAVEALQTAAKEAQAAAADAATRCAGSDRATVSDGAMAAALNPQLPLSPAVDGANRAEAARAEAEASMAGGRMFSGRGHGSASGASAAAAEGDVSGLLSLSPTDGGGGSRHGRDAPSTKQHSGKKHDRSQRDGHVVIQPLRQKRKKHHQRGG